MNLKGFPADVPKEFEIFARHPDDFILDLVNLESDAAGFIALRHHPFSNEMTKIDLLQ